MGKSSINCGFFVVFPMICHHQGLVPRHHRLHRPSLHRRAGCRGAAISGGDGAATLGQQVESGFFWGQQWILVTFNHRNVPRPWFLLNKMGLVILHLTCFVKVEGIQQKDWFHQEEFNPQQGRYQSTNVRDSCHQHK